MSPLALLCAYIIGKELTENFVKAAISGKKLTGLEGATCCSPDFCSVLGFKLRSVFRRIGIN